MNKWLLLVTALPTANATERMQAWRALKASGAAVLRDGAYLLPDSACSRLSVEDVERDILSTGGTAYLLPIDDPSGKRFIGLFDRHELQERGVAIGLIDWLAANVLPLDVPAHLQIGMTSTDYILSSAHLNTMVYQHPQRRGKSLAWKQRTKLMFKLLGGGMGFDVLHAMQPQYQLRTDVGDIAADLIEEFKKMSALRTWGWNCIIEGKPQVMPPASLL